MRYIGTYQLHYRGRHMSKYTGSITPDTVASLQSKPLDFGVLQAKLLQYEDSLKSQYDDHDETVKKDLTKYQKYEQVLKELEAFKGGKLEKVKKDFAEHMQRLKAAPHSPANNVALIDQDSCFLKIYQHDAAKAITIKKPLVRHYGIDPEHTKNLVDHIIEKHSLHPIELLLFTEAVKILGKHSAAEAFLNTSLVDRPYANNVVLLDIFPRRLDITNTTYINLDAKVGGPETHTVVLWRTKSNEITLIDPTIGSYSAFLVGMSIEGYKIVAGQDSALKLYSTNNKTPGLQPNHNAHPMVPRDCNDIAVKVAFELNECQLLGTDVQEVKELAISQISNQQIIGSLKELNTRALQSSDVNVRHDSKAIVDELLKFPSIVSSIIDFKKLTTLVEVQKVTQLLGELQGLPEAQEFFE